MTLDKFGRHINTLKKDTKIETIQKLPSLFGYYNFFLHGQVATSNPQLIRYVLHNGSTNYTFPLIKGEIVNAYLSVNNLILLINNIEYDLKKLIGAKLYKNNQIGIKYLEDEPKVFIELVIKYPVTL